MELIGIRVDKEMKEELERLAKEADRPVSNYCRQILRDHLDRVGQAGRDVIEEKADIKKIKRRLDELSKSLAMYDSDDE
jgi:predicted DNA-binding protein